MVDCSLLSIKLTDSLDKKTRNKDWYLFYSTKNGEMILNKHCYFSSFKNVEEPNLVVEEVNYI